MKEYPSETAVRRQQCRCNFIKAISLESNCEAIPSTNYKIGQEWYCLHLHYIFYVRSVSEMVFSNLRHF